MNDIKPKGEKPVTSWEVFQWPEFKAFALRLGVDLTQRIESMLVDMTNLDGLAKVTIRHQAVDMTKDIPPRHTIDTTCIHNEKHRTKILNPRQDTKEDA